MELPAFIWVFARILLLIELIINFYPFWENYHKFFFVFQYMGCVEVYESRGMQVCEEALKVLRVCIFLKFWTKLEKFDIWHEELPTFFKIINVLS